MPSASTLPITGVLAVTVLVTGSGLTAMAIVWLTRKQRSVGSIVWAATLAVAVAGVLFIGAVAAWPWDRGGSNQATGVGSGAGGDVVLSRSQRAPALGPAIHTRARGARLGSGGGSQDAPLQEAVRPTQQPGTGSPAAGEMSGGGPPAGAGPPANPGPPAGAGPPLDPGPPANPGPPEDPGPPG